VRWLAGNAADAEDVVQEAYMRAFRYFDSWTLLITSPDRFIV
jgi:DNA-directed RNA polymerase specialized sigma24 family protein